MSFKLGQTLASYAINEAMSSQHFNAFIQKSLKRHPRRLLSIKGKKEAATQLKRENIIAEASKEIKVSMAKKHRAIIL